MGQTVFVKVVGFSDVERHALNTVFRLSGEQQISYALWAPGAPESPGLALIDGQSYEAQLELASPHADPDLKLIWVGEDAPDSAWRVYGRPIQWPQVVLAMDGLFRAPASVDVDIDFDLDAPPEPATAPPEPAKRVLVINTDRDERLYLRAKCASVGLVHLDEAASAAEARELLKNQAYAAVIVDLELPDADAWQLVAEARQSNTGPPQVLLTMVRASWMVRFRAWRMGGVQACLGKPLHPGRLHRLLRLV